LDATSVFSTYVVSAAKDALTLSRLLGQDVALERVAALELAGSGLPEALCCGPIGFHLGHGMDSHRVYVTGMRGGEPHLRSTFPLVGDPGIATVIAKNATNLPLRGTCQIIRRLPKPRSSTQQDRKGPTG